MKIISVLFTLSMSLSCAVAQQAGVRITFQKLEHDFGAILQGGNGLTEFEFTNSGAEPLVISGADVSCGCTTPSYPKHAMAPGEKGAIQVKYDTNRIGEFNKSVTIKSNAEGGPVVLKIRGKVEPVATDTMHESAKPLQFPKAVNQ